MKIALLGYGKMGKMIEQVVKDHNKSGAGERHDIILKITAENAQDATPGSISNADVAIDFSQPEAAFINISRCLEAGVPVVIGTTGWLDKYEEAKKICVQKDGALLYASNFSIGVNIFFEINRRLAELMNGQKQYQVQIEETHHVQKLDAPSGTAITLAEDIIKNVKHKLKWVNEPSHKPEELVILSEREGGVVGIHEVEYYSEMDTLEIIHTAHSRKGFAEGALKAAEWIRGRKGVFSMKDVLGI